MRYLNLSQPFKKRKSFSQIIIHEMSRLFLHIDLFIFQISPLLHYLLLYRTFKLTMEDSSRVIDVLMSSASTVINVTRLYKDFYEYSILSSVFSISFCFSKNGREKIASDNDISFAITELISLLSSLSLILYPSFLHDCMLCVRY